jgi:two-component system chemotaxis response regulator CheY
MSYSILIVDDSLPMRGIIRKTLRAAGYGSSVILEAADGLQALDRLADGPVDLVISDLTMPVMDGFELVSAMKQEETLSRIPVVMVTSEGSRETREKFRDKGVAGYIRKPFTPEQLKEILTSILGEPDHGKNPDDTDNGCDF